VVHRLPYPTRRGVVTTWCRTKKFLQDEYIKKTWMDNVRQDLAEKDMDLRTALDTIRDRRWRHQHL